MADFKDNISYLAQGYEKALTFWQNFIQPQQPGLEIPQTGGVVYNPTGNAILDEYYRTLPANQRIAMPAQMASEAGRFSAEYAAQAAKAARYDVNVNPAVVMPAYYGGAVPGLPPLPYLLPAQQQIFRPIDIAAPIAAMERGALEGVPATGLSSSFIEQFYGYNRARIGAFTSSFAPMILKTPFDILAFGMAERIVSRAVGASVLGNIPILGGVSRFIGTTALGLGLSAAFGFGVQKLIDTVQLHNERAAAAEMLTKEFVVAGPEVSAMGRGLSAPGAAKLGYGMMRMAERMGIVSYRDIEEILKVGSASGLFMMDQTTGDIEKRLKSVIKVFGEIAKITNDPNIQEQLRNLGELYKFGGNLESSLATFEMAGLAGRVTGMSYNHLMKSYGAMGISTFQAMGLVPASGAFYGVHARAAAQLAAASGTFTPERLATLGGVEGLTASLIRTQAVSAAAYTNLILPSVITAGPGGSMGVDINAAVAYAYSSNPLAALQLQPQRLAAFARQAGVSMPMALQMYGLNANILQSELMRNNPYIGEIATVNLANQITRMSGGQIAFETALQMLGLSKEESIAKAKMYTNPEYLRSLKNQIQTQMAEASARSYDETRNALSSLGMGWQLGVAIPFEHFTLGPGRWMHQNIVAPYRTAAQIESLRGTGLYARQVAASGLTASDFSGGVMADISEWWGRPFVSRGEEAKVELATGKSWLTSARAKWIGQPKWLNYTIVGGKLLLGALAGTFLTPIAAAPFMAWAAEDIYAGATTPTERESREAVLNRVSDMYLMQQAATSKVEANELAARRFLEAFKENRQITIRSFAKSEEEALSIAAALREMGSNVSGLSDTAKALYQNWSLSMQQAHIARDQMSGELINAVKEHTKTKMRETSWRFSHVGLTGPTGSWWDTVIEDPIAKKAFGAMQTAVLAIQDSPEKLSKFYSLMEQMRGAKTEKERSKIIAQIRQLVGDITFAEGGEIVDWYELFGKEETRSELFRALREIQAVSPIEPFKFISQISSLGPYISPELLERIKEEGLTPDVLKAAREEVEKKLDHGLLPYKEQIDKAAKEVEENLKQDIDKSGRLTRDITININNRAIRLQRGTDINAALEMARLQMYSTAEEKMARGPATGGASFAPGSSVEANKKLLEAIDKLIEAAQDIKSAAKTASEVKPYEEKKAK